MSPAEETERQMREIYPDLDRVGNPRNDCNGCFFSQKIVGLALIIEWELGITGLMGLTIKILFTEKSQI